MPPALSHFFISSHCPSLALYALSPPVLPSQPPILLLPLGSTFMFPPLDAARMQVCGGGMKWADRMSGWAHKWVAKRQIDRRMEEGQGDVQVGGQMCRQMSG